MALIIPEISFSFSKMTSGEKRFARCIEEKLEDDYLCWYDVPVGKKKLCPDFIILHPRRGILVLGTVVFGSREEAIRAGYNLVGFASLKQTLICMIFGKTENTM